VAVAVAVAVVWVHDSCLPTQLARHTEDRIAALGESFFDASSPFDDLDVQELVPLVKQTPLLDYAEGTALFVRARSKQGAEGSLPQRRGVAMCVR